MADNLVEFKLDGLAEAQARLEALHQDLRRKVVLGALRDAARPFVRQARIEAPVLQTATSRRVPGVLRKNIKSFTSKKYRGSNGVLGVYLSVRASRKDLKNSPVSGDPYYYRWVFGGHKIVPRSKRLGVRYGKNMNAVTLASRRSAATRFIQPNDVFGRAFGARNAEALRIFVARINERIDLANRAKS